MASKALIAEPLCRHLQQKAQRSIGRNILSYKISHVSRQSAWNMFGSKSWYWRGMPTILGVNSCVNFFGGEGGWNPGETRPKNSEGKFAGKLVGNSPKIRQTQIKSSTQIRSAEPWVRDQDPLPEDLLHTWSWSSQILLLRVRRIMTMTKIPSRKNCYTYDYGHLKFLHHKSSRGKTLDRLEVSPSPDK